MMETSKAHPCDKDSIIEELQNKVNYLMIKCSVENYNDKYVKCSRENCNKIEDIAHNKEYIDKHNILLENYVCSVHRYCRKAACNELCCNGYPTCYNHRRTCLTCDEDTNGNGFLCAACRAPIYS